MIELFSTNDRKQKLGLIAFIIESCLQEHPDREDQWYGDKFDELYDTSLPALFVIKKMREKRMKKMY